MARQVLGFGADVEVLAPTSLADSVRQSAADAVAAYAALDRDGGAALEPH
jgi:predicted DNA-binding transcriptional regulator YafY